MWTLRDLWFLLNPDAEEKWREEEAKKLRRFKPSPRDANGNIDMKAFMADPYVGRWHDGNMDGGSLRDILKYKNNQINTSPNLSEERESPLEAYGRGADSGWYRHKYPPKYKGLL